LGPCVRQRTDPQEQPFHNRSFTFHLALKDDHENNARHGLETGVLTLGKFGLNATTGKGESTPVTQPGDGKGTR
jgi:hypothetical protein